MTETTPTEQPEVLYEVAEPVATITLNRPEALNAWTPTMEVEFREAMQRAIDDPAVVGIILTGAGRGFCAGVDLRLLQSYSKGERDQLISRDVAVPGDPTWGEDFRGPYSFLMSVPKPIVAAINGPVAGMAFAIVLACDVRFMAAGARMTTAFAERGLIAEWGLSWLLPRLTGSATALDLMFSARTVGAEEALAHGIVNRVVADDDLVGEARAYLTDIAERCSPTSIAIMKRQVYTQLHAGLAEAERDARRLMMESFGRPDALEGVRAFLDKRPPKYERLSGLLP